MGIDVDSDDLCIREQLAALQHPVESNARGNDYISLGQSCHDTGETAVADGQRMTVGLEDEGGPLPDELQAAINTALESLPDKQRLALVLFSVEGMPQKQVAEILECSVELVKWNVFQARQKLKVKLKEFL